MNRQMVPRAQVVWLTLILILTLGACQSGQADTATPILIATVQSKAASRAPERGRRGPRPESPVPPDPHVMEKRIPGGEFENEKLPSCVGAPNPRSPQPSQPRAKSRLPQAWSGHVANLLAA